MATENPGAGLSTEVVDGTFALAREGRVSELTEMVRAGVPVDTRNARSDTMLIVAAYAQQADAVAALIALGADLNIENTMGQTAISCAVFRNDAAILQMLLDAGADPDLGFRSALAIADQFQLTDMTALLVKHAAR
ncbi:ankyrin repeat domain-containing protein [Microbacterium sp. NC79]|uniref:ankyrin repeat domain-containing protein n=1 Tax=Microbacterium sp. NC79 TaxID=2851009 RepID=UPI001C2C54CF|nr:ankyrin repeat domain-containing protein [Microbacterium sp. NC79]MBV0895067.1 ankyrin repeat domain-containing protein [Microbacterium sp. NC79]